MRSSENTLSEEAKQAYLQVNMSALRLNAYVFGAMSELEFTACPLDAEPTISSLLPHIVSGWNQKFNYFQEKEMQIIDDKSQQERLPEIGIFWENHKEEIKALLPEIAKRTALLAAMTYIPYATLNMMDSYQNRYPYPYIEAKIRAEILPSMTIPEVAEDRKTELRAHLQDLKEQKDTMFPINMRSLFDQDERKFLTLFQNQFLDIRTYGHTTLPRGDLLETIDYAYLSSKRDFDIKDYGTIISYLQGMQIRLLRMMFKPNDGGNMDEPTFPPEPSIPADDPFAVPYRRKS